MGSVIDYIECPNCGHIREMCNGSKIRKKVGGYIWSYKQLLTN
jgi:hypothetical protein